MQTYTYSGETPAEAMLKAKNELGDGDNVVLIQSREVRKKSLNQPALHEMVFGILNESNKPESQAKTTPLPNNSVQKRLDAIAQKEITQKKKGKSFNQIFDDDGVSLELSDKALLDTLDEIRKISEENIAPKPKTPQQQKTPSTSKEIVQKALESRTLTENNSSLKHFEEIQKELFKLNDKIRLIQNTLWDEKSPKDFNIQVPTEFAEIYRIAKASGMNKEHLEEIMQLSIEYMPLKMREQSKTIKRYFREVLRKMIYCRHENDVGRKIIMFVGPTGVGKTTTIAKLAARYSQILPNKKKVGIITLDDYRIGAMDQLAWYARKMRLSIDSVSEADDLIQKIESLRYCDYILIDTAGHSQHDKQKILELKKFIKNDDYKIDVALVLSAVTKYEDLKDCYEAFGELNIDTFIFSKLDEARGLGNIFSLVYESKKPISYLSIGQEVPNDLIVSDNKYLADCLLGGFFYPDSHSK